MGRFSRERLFWTTLVQAGRVGVFFFPNHALRTVTLWCMSQKIVLPLPNSWCVSFGAGAGACRKERVGRFGGLFLLGLSSLATRRDTGLDLPRMARD